VTAAQTLVSVHTPRGRDGFALGALSTALFSGMIVGTSLGGVFADAFGYRAAFFFASFLFLCAALLVAFGVQEQFERKAASPSRAAGQSRRPLNLAPVLPVLPLLCLIVAMAGVRQFDAPFLPLLVQDIHGGIEGAASWTGLLAGFSGVAGLLAGFFLGSLADRVPPPTIARWSAGAAGLLMLPQALAYGFGVLFPARFGMIFFAGGLDPVFLVWLTKVTPAEVRGSIFGWAATAKSVGWVAAPLASGMIASAFGLRAIYYAAALLFFALIPLISVATRALVRQGTVQPHHQT
jgi:MFS family permease